MSKIRSSYTTQNSVNNSLHLKRQSLLNNKVPKVEENGRSSADDKQSCNQIDHSRTNGPSVLNSNMTDSENRAYKDVRDQDSCLQTNQTQLQY